MKIARFLPIFVVLAMCCSVAFAQDDCPTNSLCLLNGQFIVTLKARDPRTNREVTGTRVPTVSATAFGIFSLPAFTGDLNNPEVFVKIVDGRTVTGTFWVFYGGLTDLEY